MSAEIKSAALHDLIVKLLGEAVLRARALAWSGSVDRCGIELDHVHNLPFLLTSYKPELLLFYWDIERPCFLGQSEGVDTSGFADIWEGLAVHVEEERRRTRGSGVSTGVGPQKKS